MDFDISFKGDYFDVKLTGTPTIEDCCEYFNQLTSHEHWQPGSFVLSDETQLDTGILSTDTVLAMAGICRDKKEAMGQARFAAYVSSPVGYGMNRMFQGHSEFEWDAEIRVFKTRSEALEWLLREIERL